MSRKILNVSAVFLLSLFVKFIKLVILAPIYFHGFFLLRKILGRLRRWGFRVFTPNPAHLAISRSILWALALIRSSIRVASRSPALFPRPLPHPQSTVTRTRGHFIRLNGLLPVHSVIASACLVLELPRGRSLFGW